MSILSVEVLLHAYSQGYFPMANDDGMIEWFCPNPRAIIPIESYKPSKSLRNVLNQKIFEIKINTNFEEVIKACSKPRFVGDGSWISDEMIKIYAELNKLGFAHSVEAYYEGELAGGLYGAQLGGVFYGESMFTKVSNASKVAFHFLMMILKNEGFELLDTQFMNSNVKRYGAIHIPRNRFLNMLQEAIFKDCSFKMKS